MGTTVDDDDALPEDWRYRGLGEGVVAEDDGVAMTAERVASRVVVADVVGSVERAVANRWTRQWAVGWGVGDV